MSLTRLWMIPIALLALLAGCTTTPEIVTVPTLASLPTVMPSPDSPSLPTATASDTPSLTPTLTQTAIATAIAATITPTETETPAPSRTPTDTMPTDTTPTATFTVTPSLTITQTPLATQADDPLPRFFTGSLGIDQVTLTAPPLIPNNFLTVIPTLTPMPTTTSVASPTPLPRIAGIGDATIAAVGQELVTLMTQPTEAGRPVQALVSGESIFLIGRSSDGGWYQARTVDHVEGWVQARYVVTWIDLSRLVTTWVQPTAAPQLVASLDGFAFGGHVLNMDRDTFDAMRRSGMGWLKIQHRYYVGQPAETVLPIIRGAQNLGFRVLIGLVGDQAQLAQDFDRYIVSFGSFAAGVAALGADAIEIWNEPNIDREWPKGMINGASYTRLLANAYTQIKAVNPLTVVISAAPAPTGFFGPAGCGDGGCNDDAYFRQMGTAGAADFLDCVGLHHNDGIISPRLTSGDPRGSYPTFYLRSLLGRVPPQFAGKPICVTEIGYLSPQGLGSLPPNFAWASRTTVTDQAEWLADALRILRADPRVQMMIVWNVDFDEVWRFDDPMAGYAILRPGGSCPACDALAQAINES